jgi:hypothetical protein
MKKLFAIFGILSLALAACEPSTEGPQSTNQQIKLVTNETVNVGSGSAMGLIQYEILDMIQGAEIKAKADVEWIINFDFKQQGKIQFTVEKNPDAVKREGTITITYDKSTLKVKVIQALSEAPTNQEIKIEKLQGKYYGNYAGLQWGMYNYYVVFTDLGMDASNEFYTPNAHYYFVDLYLDTPPADLNNIVVPNGVYEYDISNSGFMNTFTESCSWYQINDESGFAIPDYQIHYDKGTVTFEDGKATLEVTLEIDHTQQNHKVIFEGEYSLLDCTSEVY